MNKLYVLIFFFSSSIYASSYKDYICAGGNTISKTPIILTPTVGAITSNLTASKNFNVTLTGDATINASNISGGAGETYVYVVKRDGLGAHVVNFGSDFILDNSITTIGTGTEESLIPIMSNGTTPAPYANDASTSYDPSTYVPWKAFNGSKGAADRWLSQNAFTSEWLKIDMGATNFAYITKYHVEVVSNLAAAPKNWSFEASQDGTNWTVLDTQSNITAWVVDNPRVFGISTTTIPYRYLRLNISANNGETHIEVGNFEIYGIKGPSATTTDYFKFYNTGSELILEKHWTKH